MTRVLFLLVFLAACRATVSFADQNNAAQERKDDQRVKDAQQALAKAKDRLNDLQKEFNKTNDQLRKLSAEQRAAEVAAGKEREEAKQRADDSPQIKQALADADKAKTEFERATAPILKALKATAEYRTLSEAAEKARGEIRTVSTDPKLLPEQRMIRLAELSRTLNAPAEAEQAAIAKDAAAAAAQKKLHAAESKLTELREKGRDNLERDSKFARALKTLEESNRDLAKAQSELDRHRQEIGRQQREVASKQQNVEQAQKADKQNDKTRTIRRNEARLPVLAWSMSGIERAASPHSCQNVLPVKASPMLHEEFNWKEEVLQSAEPVLVDFWSARCQPCLMMNPILKSLAKDFKICKVNVDTNPELADHYGISGIPALKIFKDGKIAKEFLGLTQEDVLRTELEQLSKA